MATKTSRQSRIAVVEPASEPVAPEAAPDIAPQVGDEVTSEAGSSQAASPEAGPEADAPEAVTEPAAPLTNSSTSADQVPDPPTIGSASTAPPAAPPASPFKVTPIRHGAGQSRMTQPPPNPRLWSYMAGCPVPLTLGVTDEIDAGAEFPHAGVVGSFEWWPLVWRRPSEATRLPDGVTLPNAQELYDTAAERLRLAGYTVPD